MSDTASRAESLAGEPGPGAEARRAALRAAIRATGGAAVAFSGGVDSSLLCAVARSELGAASIAITLSSPLLPASELADARKVAALVGIEHLVLEEEGIEEDVAANPPDRCYHCKKREFGRIIAAARERGFGVVLDGSNADDADDYRPGARAIAELGVASPLRDAGLTKAEVRAMSRDLGLPTWDKPAFACLASRVPYGDRIDAALMSRVERAEDYLRSLGLRQVRVRAHGGIARIEVAPEERRMLFSETLMDAAAARMRELGFEYACMELAGYERGSLNRAIGK